MSTSRIVTAEDLRVFEHPWLVVEDAHVNSGPILVHLDSGIVPGDSLVVEDSYRKRKHLRALLDLKYLDMLGEDSVCSMDFRFGAGPER